jgi:predicted component of type VI protein secretion system
MDDTRQPDEAFGLPLQGPHRRPGPEVEPDAACAPLRLRLQPGGLAVDLTRPDVLVGRHSEADVRLALPDVSRRHCRFVYRDRRWHVYDLNSLNGIFVNGERVQQAVLVDHDLVRIGGLTFEVELNPEPRGETVQSPGPAADVQALESLISALPHHHGKRRAS